MKSFVLFISICLSGVSYAGDCGSALDHALGDGSGTAINKADAIAAANKAAVANAVSYCISLMETTCNAHSIVGENHVTSCTVAKSTAQFKTKFFGKSKCFAGMESEEWTCESAAQAKCAAACTPES